MQLKELPVQLEVRIFVKLSSGYLLVQPFRLMYLFHFFFFYLIVLVLGTDIHQYSGGGAREHDKFQCAGCRLLAASV